MCSRLCYASSVQHALPARNNATDKLHRRASMASQIVLRWLGIVRQRLAHRNQVPHFPCFPSMELMRVRGCIWQNVFKFQAGPLQSTEAWHSGTRRLAKHQPSHLVAVWPNWTAISTNKFAAQWRDTPKSKITPGILITGCLQFGIAFLCSPKCIFLSTWPGSPGLISRQLGRMRTTSKAS